MFVLVGGLIVLALTVALVGPYFVDWTTYRADFEREASRILGREVTVEGSATARLLPFPSVNFSDVRVAGDTPDEPAMTIESFSMDAELAPFLRGEVLIFDMRLVRPHARVSMAPDGALDWAMRPAARIGPTHISLEKLTISEGRVTLDHQASGRRHLLSEINADVSARTLAGPWRFDGSLRIDGMVTALSVSTGAVDERDAIRLRLRAEPERYPVALEADGALSLVDGAPRYAGTFRFDAHNGPRPRADDIAARAKPADYRFNGGFAFDHRRLDLTEFRLETGPREDPYTADGTAMIDLGAEPRFLVRATGAQVRFDDAVAQQGDRPGVAFAERLEALKDALQNLPRPTMKGTVDLDLPAIVTGDTTIRNVTMSAEPGEGGWTVHSLGATLPGRTTLEAKGFLHTTDTLGFRGRLLLAVAQPSGFAAWLARDVDDAIRRLPAAGFSADVDLGEDRQAFRDLELVLGAARFTGALERRASAGAKPVMIAALEGDALDVDGMAAFASLFVSDDGAAHFAGHDIDFDLKAGPVSVAGIVAETVDTALRLRGDRLDVDRLTVTGVEGADVTATAVIRDMGTAPSGELDASLLAEDLAPFVRLLAARFPGNRIATGLARRADGFTGLMEDARIDIVARLPAIDTEAGEASLDASGRLGGSTFTLAVTAAEYDGDPASAPLSLTLDAAGEDTGELLAFLGLPVVDLGVTGAGEARFTLEGRLVEGAAVSLSLTAPEARGSFTGVAQVAGDDVWAKGRVALSGDDLEPWLLTVGAALPGMGIGLPARLEADADYADGRLKLAGIRGTVAEALIEGDVEATLGEDGLPHVTGALSLGALDMTHAAALVLGGSSLEGEGRGWPDRPFAPAVSTPFTGEIVLSVAALEIAPGLPADDVRMKARLDRTGLILSEIAGTAFGGRFSGLVDLKNNEGTGLLAAQIALEGSDAEIVLGEPGMQGSLDLSAALTASGKTIGGLAAGLAGSGTVTMKGLVVPGVDPGAFPALLAGADVVGREIDEAKTRDFAPALIEAGSVAVEDETVPFTIAGGILRTPPFFLRGDGMEIAAEARLDAGADEIAVTGTLAYAPGDDALIGSDPQVGFSLSGPYGQTVRTLDMAPLAQFLTQRALEREQARVEAMQAELLEKQRLRREVRYYAQLDDLRRVAAEEEAIRQAEEAERRRIEEEARLLEEEEARLIAEEEARLAAEAEALRKAAEEEARLIAEEEARVRAEAEEQARAKAEEEARLKAEEGARLKAEAEEAARLKAEEEARRKAEAEEEARRKAEEARLKAEEEARLKAEAEEAARLKAEEEARRKAEAEEEARLKAEEDARRQAEAEARAREEARAKAEAEAARMRAADDARRRAEEAARLKAEEEARGNTRYETRPRAGTDGGATISRQPLPPPTRPERASRGGALEFDAPTIEEFLKSSASD